LTGSAWTAQYRGHGSRSFSRAFLAPPPPVITGLDHVVVAAWDLDAAVRAYEVVLGRRCEWRTDAHGGGAQVAAFGLANLSLELMAPAGDGPMADRLRAVLEAQGEGLASLAFAVGDIERAHRRLGRVNLDPEPITSAESAGRDGGRRAWRRTRASMAATHGVRMFFMQQPPLPVSPALASLGAAVAGLDHVVIHTPDPDRAAALYGARLGLDLRLDRSNAAWGTRLMFLRCGDLVVELSHDLKAGVSPDPDRLWGLSWRVPDAQSARARLHAAGLDVSEVRPGRKPGTRVFTVNGGTCGVPTLMLEPAGPPP